MRAELRHGLCPHCARTAPAHATGLSGRMGVNILIVSCGYEKKLEGTLLRGEPSQFYTEDTAEAVSSVLVKVRDHCCLTGEPCVIVAISCNIF